VAPARPERIGGARLLGADLRVGFMLMNEGRHRTFERGLGLSRNQTNLATAVLVLVLADAAHDQYRRVMDATAPSPGDVALATAAVRQLMLGSTSTATPDLAVFGALAAFALGGRIAIPAATKSVRGVATAVIELRSLISRRYLRRAAAAR
jgi:hypothetical protein